MEACHRWHGGPGCICDVMGHNDPIASDVVAHIDALVGTPLSDWQLHAVRAIFASGRFGVRTLEHRSRPARLCVDGRAYRRRLKGRRR